MKLRQSISHPVFKMAADAELPDGKYALGWCYHCGHGVAEDERETTRLYKSVTEKWFPDSDTGFTCGVVRNMYANACELLGDCYKEGRGVDADISEALRYYKAAARSGNHKAAKSLGWLYLRGCDGLEASPSAAVYWLQHAVWGNIGKPECDVDLYAEKYLKEAKEDLEKAGGDEDIESSLREIEEDFKKAYSGNAEAQLAVAERYEECEGVDQEDAAAAVYWRNLAALSGSVDAQFEVGLAYYLGDGVEENNDKSFMFFSKAAEQGSVDALYRLGECFQKGFGVEKDVVKAISLYEKAAENNQTSAQHALGELYYYGKGIAVDYDRAFHWFKIAAEKKYSSTVLLGECYEYGRGVTQDVSKAIELYHEAADGGNEEAKAALERLGA